MKRNYYIWPTVIALALALGIFLGGKLNFNDSPEKLFTTNSKKDKLNRLIDYIDYEYVDEINTDSIVDVTVNNILNKLDPHSVYIPKGEMKRVSENMKGDFVGIGINFYMYKDTIAVIRAVEKGPSSLKGLQPGDRILVADGDTLHGKRLPSDVIVSKLKGTEGSKVDLKVYRKRENRTFSVTLKRDHIPLKSVEAYFMLSPDMGYIKVNRFAESTYKEFISALRSLQRQGAKKLTLDLRDNPGGYLSIAEKLADEFLEDGKLILFTKNKNGEVSNSYATSRGIFEARQVYVLINERSASASEIIAGALQDNDVGTIVGRRSFGKGLVQREMELGDGSAIRLTVSRYYTPTGRSIQKSYANGTKDYYEKFTDRYHNGELLSVDSIKVADSLKFTTPKGNVVYGGGGIIPDVFVPIGSNEEEAVESLDSGYGLFSRFVFEHLEEDRNRYKDMSEQKFYDRFIIDDILFENFINYAEQWPLVQKLNLRYYDLEELIKSNLKAAMAAQLFNSNVQSRIKASSDAMLQKVLELDQPAIQQEESGRIKAND
jgi:carboxyl-terminal processing protease